MIPKHSATYNPSPKHTSFGRRDSSSSRKLNDDEDDLFQRSNTGASSANIVDYMKSAGPLQQKSFVNEKPSTTRPMQTMPISGGRASPHMTMQPSPASSQRKDYGLDLGKSLNIIEEENPSSHHGLSSMVKSPHIPVQEKVKVKKDLNPFRESKFTDASLAEQDQYMNSMNKASENMTHFHHHYDPKIKNKASRIAKGSGTYQKPDKLEVLQDENINLKTHQKELETDIRIIATKFQRQINLLKKDRLVGGGGGRTQITHQFEQDFDELIEKNNKLQMQEAELMDKVKKQQVKRKKELNQGKIPYSVNPTSYDRPSKQEADQVHVLKALQVTLDKSQKKIIGLTQDLEKSKRLRSSNIDVGTLQMTRREVELKLMQARARLEDVKANLSVKQDIFKSGKQYEDSLFTQLKEMQAETNKLTTQNRTLEASSTVNAEIRDRITEAKEERDRMQEKFNSITSQPFFRKESDKETLDELGKLQKLLDQREKEIADSTRNVKKQNADMIKISEETKKTQESKEHFQDELMKMKSHLDPTSLTLSDVMKKLRSEDESRFREVMADLEYEGTDPEWYKRAFMEQLNQISGDNKLNENDMKSLISHRDRHINEKAELAGALAKTQNLLKLQVDIDKQNSALQTQELNGMHGSIKHLNNKSNELTLIIKKRNTHILKLQQSTGPKGLTAADLDRFNYDMHQVKQEQRAIGGGEDAMTEYSAMTGESEIKPEENILDLRINQAWLDQTNLIQFTGGNALEAGSFQTFLAVDFYNHDTQNTGLTDGFEPKFNTLFSFKNISDDFYIKFLERDSILVDIYYVPKTSKGAAGSAGSIKLGSANLPLNKLIEKDYGPQWQSIMTTNNISVGKMSYSFRPRKSLDSAIRWYNERKNLQNKTSTKKKSLVGPAVDDEMMVKKIIEIEVEKAEDLRINGLNNTYSQQRMQPFFTYDFYSFSYTSAALQSPNPVWRIKRTFDVEANSEFNSYMAKNVLKIDFIDESVDMNQLGQRDYIGSARIPLKNLILKGKIDSEPYSIIDEFDREAGKVTVRMAIHDAEKFTYDNMFTDSSKIVNSKRIQQEVVMQIVNKLAEAEFEDFNTFLDLLFFKDNTNMQRVTRRMFADFIMTDMGVPVNHRNLDIFMKTHEILGTKELYERAELKAIFTGPFQEALDRQIDIQANRSQMRSNYGRTYQNTMNKSSIHNQSMFGNESPKRAVDNPWETAKSYNQQTTGQPQGDFENMQSSAIGRQSIKLTQMKQADTAFQGQITVLESLFKSDRLYEVIQKFQNECGVDYPGATIDQTKNVLLKFKDVTTESIEQFFYKYQIGGDLYYNEQLINLYGKKPKVQQHIRMNKISDEASKELIYMKTTLYNYIKKKNYSLNDLFQYLDRAKSQEISIDDMQHGLKNVLNKNQIITLFKHIDIDGSNSITIDELQQELSVINSALVLDKIKETVDSVKDMTVLKLFEVYDADSKGGIDVVEFSKLVEHNNAECGKYEIDLLFNSVDKEAKGFITLNDLTRALNNIDEVFVSKVHIHPNDILLPFTTLAKNRNNRTTSQLFERFKGADERISHLEFFSMIHYFLQFELTEDEKDLMKSFLESVAKSKQGLTKDNLDEILSMNAIKTSSLGGGDRILSEKSFKHIKAHMKAKGKKFMSEIEDFQSESEKKRGEINMRSFKHFLYMTVSLSTYEAENLVQFLDREKNGFIKIVKVQNNLQ